MDTIIKSEPEVDLNESEDANNHTTEILGLNIEPQKITSQRPSQIQKTFLIDYMYRRFKTSKERTVEKVNWQELSNQLNKLGGAQKTPQKWQKCWGDHQRDIWKKFNKLHNNEWKARDPTRPLSIFERKVLDTVRPHSFRFKTQKKKITPATLTMNSVRPSKIQKRFLVDYMFRNKNFANRLFKTPEESSNEKVKWQKLSDTLNKLDGSHKTPQKWRKCWLDHRREVWKKVNQLHNKKSKARNQIQSLNIYEKKVLDIVRPDSIWFKKREQQIEPETGRKFATQPHLLRTKRPTTQQREFLVDHLLASYEFAVKQSHANTELKPISINWNELSEILNSIGGSLKSPRQWYRFWLDQRYNVRKKFKDENNDNLSTINNNMKSYEIKIIELIKPEIFQTGKVPVVDYSYASNFSENTNSNDSSHSTPAIETNSNHSNEDTILSFSEIKQEIDSDVEYVIHIQDETESNNEHGTDEMESNIDIEQPQIINVDLKQQQTRQPAKRKRRRIVNGSNLILQKYVIGQQQKLKIKKQELVISQRNSDSLASVADSIRMLSNSFKSLVDFMTQPK